MIEVLKQMIEVLKYIDEGANNQGAHTGISWRDVSNKAQPAIQAGRQAIAELESQYLHGMYGAEDLDKAWKSGYDNCKDQFAYLDKQEPVAWMYESVCGNDFATRNDPPSYANNIRLLYTHPPQRKPLTDEQIKKASLEAGMQEHYMDFHSGFIRFARAIEAAHGIKGEA